MTLENRIPAQYPVSSNIAAYSSGVKFKHLFRAGRLFCAKGNRKEILQSKQDVLSRSIVLSKDLEHVDILSDIQALDVCVIASMQAEMHNDAHYSDALWFCLYVLNTDEHTLVYGRRKIPLSVGDIIIMNARYNHALEAAGKSFFSAICLDYKRRPSEADLLRDLSTVNKKCHRTDISFS